MFSHNPKGRQFKSAPHRGRLAGKSSKRPSYLSYELRPLPQIDLLFQDQDSPHWFPIQLPLET